MKKLILILVLVVAVVGGMLFFLKDKKGRPLVKLDENNMPKISLSDIDFSFFKKKSLKPIEKERLSEKSMVPEEGQDVEAFYIYKDDKGVTHVTNQKPNQEKYEVTYLQQFKPENEKSGLDKIKESFNFLSKDDKEKKSQKKNSTPVKDPFSGQIYEDAEELQKHYEDMYKDQ